MCASISFCTTSQNARLHQGCFANDASLIVYRTKRQQRTLHGSPLLFVKIHLHLCHGRASTAPSHTEGCCDLASRLMSTYWRQRYCLCSHSLCPVRFRKDSSV